MPDVNTSGKSLNRPLIVGLGALALLRPLVSTIGTQLGIDDPPAVPITLTLAISIVWIAVVGFGRAARPLLTLVLVGGVYGVLSILLSAILSPILTGELQGPLATPIAIIPVLLTNIVWGLVCGAIALLIQVLRARRTRAADATR